MKRRSPWALGWEAIRANFWPALLIQTAMLGLLLAYYFSLTSREALDALALFKTRHHWPFVIAASILAGAILPEIFLVVFFQRGRLTKRNLRSLLFTIPIWAVDGSIVDLLYRGEAALLGNVVTVPVVIGKICIDQFGYNPFFADPFGVLTYEWKNSGFTFESLGRAFTWTHYREKIIPTLLATWAVWIPLMAAIYSLPLSLQFPLFSLALTFWVLLLTYMTNAFSKLSVGPVDPLNLSAPIAEIAR